MKKSVSILGMAVIVASFAGAAFADTKHAQLPKTAVSMEQAMKAATDRYPGRVIEAELEAEDGAAEYEITVVSASGEQREVKVDAQSGKVSEESEAEKTAHDTK